MSTPPIKYNPAFLTDEQLDAAFVVRHDDRDIVLKAIRDNTGDSNQHVLIIGPRGIGKTMLTQCIALAVRKDETLQRQWYPLVFSEESYEVGSAAEFWLEALFHLANQTGDANWMATYKELRGEQDEARLSARAQAQLMDFADRQDKRILLVVENLNMILGDQLHDDCAWKLRHTLMHEPRVMLLATATAQFDLPENTNKAFFEGFKTHELQPLNDNDCRAIWQAIAGHDLGPNRIRALSILTGGNPRLLTIISYFGARLSFTGLMHDLTALVDDHTDYFKSHLEALPPTERKVYVALADLWDPVLARDVAAAARLNTSKTSALLKRLVDRGAVTVVPGKGRTKRYRVTERMYNVYYLMRRRGAPSERVRAAVHFMVQFYDDKDILEIVRHLGTEACELQTPDRLPEEVLPWARRAVELSDDPGIKCVLACILAREGRAPESLELLTHLLADADVMETMIAQMVALFAELAVAGYADDANRILLNSPSSTVLEPVGVALKMFLGEETSVAPEIEQIAADVLATFKAIVR
ncbi:MAG: AAA family ATPase [Lentisphaerae bacterium]|nr:AAA family ATPase [Lentisphaerota bacterium]